MKVHVDGHRCQGTGLCVAVAPEVFAIQPNGSAAPVVDEVDGEQLSDAREAVHICPMAAVSLGENDPSS